MSSGKRCFVAGMLMIAECWWMALMPVTIGVPGMLAINGLAFYVLKD